MTRRKKKIYLPNGETFDYQGKQYRAMLVGEDTKPCKRCAFGKDTIASAEGCRDHVCEIEHGALFFEKVK